MTGQLLNRLIGPDCIVTHDLPCEGFNIDHIVIAPRAVYAVETKSFRKPRGSSNDSHYKVTFDGEALRFPDWGDDAPVIQARRQAKWLARYLSESLGRELPVIPAIALRSEDHTSELQSLMRSSYAVVCFKKKTTQNK